jgi:hypothetical protein
VAGSVAGLAIAATIAAGALGLISTLPTPPSGATFGVRVLTFLDRLRGTRTIVRLDGAPPFTLDCRAHRGGDLIRHGSRPLLFLHGPHAYRRPDMTASPQVMRALAILAACPKLMTVELADRLRRGEQLFMKVPSRNTRVAVLRIGRGRPVIELVVARASLRPLAIRLAATRARGTASVIRIWRIPQRRHAGD